jgi:type II secretory pathway component PulK
MTKNIRSRQGFALVVALVVMAVLSVLLSVVTVQVVSQRKLLVQRQRQLQAEWLARAGVEIAAARLLEKPEAFSDDKVKLLDDAKVRIAVEKAGSTTFDVKVDVEVGAKDESQVVRTLTARFEREEKEGRFFLQAK